MVVSPDDAQPTRNKKYSTDVVRTMICSLNIMGQKVKTRSLSPQSISQQVFAINGA